MKNGGHLIALVHALRLAMEPVEQAFANHWPEATTFNLLDDSLSRVLLEAGYESQAVRNRVGDLARYAHGAGAEAILFTCSAFGQSIAAAGSVVPVPVLKPNQAMIDQALRLPGPIGVVATFAPALDALRDELEEEAGRRGIEPGLALRHAPGALEALEAGDGETHDRLITEAAASMEDRAVILLAQFSMARARRHLETRLGRPVLSSPRSAVDSLKELFRGQENNPGSEPQ